MSAFERLKRERLIKMVTDGRDFEEVDSPPHGELQGIIDRMEGASDPFGDFAQGDDYGDDLYDGRMDLGYDENE